MRGIRHRGDTLAGRLDEVAKVGKEACFVNGGKNFRRCGTVGAPASRASAKWSPRPLRSVSASSRLNPHLHAMPVHAGGEAATSSATMGDQGDWSAVR